MRPSGRTPEELREVTITRQFTKHAEGSVLISVGDTKVICTASVETNVPKFIKGQGKGWITAEYGLLPRSTNDRNPREAARGKQSGRTQEIQRLIGRALRTMVDLKALGENTITIDCDVIQADGGTRTASITGASAALIDAINWMQSRNLVKKNPLKQTVAAISVGIYKGAPVLDLDYAEDCAADTDMNIVMDNQGRFIEVQGTAENEPYTQEELSQMLSLAESGIKTLIQKIQTS